VRLSLSAAFGGIRLCPASGENRNGRTGGPLAVRDETGHAVCRGAVSAGISRGELRGESLVGGADVLGEGNDSARGVLSSCGQGNPGTLFAPLLRRLRVDPKGSIA